MKPVNNTSTTNTLVATPVNAKKGKKPSAAEKILNAPFTDENLALVRTLMSEPEYKIEVGPDGLVTEAELAKIDDTTGEHQSNTLFNKINAELVNIHLNDYEAPLDTNSINLTADIMRIVIPAFINSPDELSAQIIQSPLMKGKDADLPQLMKGVKAEAEWKEIISDGKGMQKVLSSIATAIKAEGSENGLSSNPDQAKLSYEFDLLAKKIDVSKTNIKAPNKLVRGVVGTVKYTGIGVSALGTLASLALGGFDMATGNQYNTFADGGEQAIERLVTPGKTIADLKTSFAQFAQDNTNKANQVKGQAPKVSGDTSGSEISKQIEANKNNPYVASSDTRSQAKRRENILSFLETAKTSEPDRIPFEVANIAVAKEGTPTNNDEINMFKAVINGKPHGLYYLPPVGASSSKEIVAIQEFDNGSKSIDDFKKQNTGFTPTGNTTLIIIDQGLTGVSVDVITIAKGVDKVIKKATP